MGSLLFKFILIKVGVVRTNGYMLAVDLHCTLNVFYLFLIHVYVSLPQLDCSGLEESLCTDLTLNATGRDSSDNEKTAGYHPLHLFLWCTVCEGVHVQ